MMQVSCLAFNVAFRASGTRRDKARSAGHIEFMGKERNASRRSTSGFLLSLLLSAAAHGQDPQPPSDAGAAPDGDVAAPESGVIDLAEVVTRFEASLELERLIEAREFAAAAVVGDRLLALTQDEFGEVSSETADAHIALAQVHVVNGDHDAAEQRYLEAIDIFREIDGAFSDDLIPPLLGLGDNYQQDGQFLNAVSAYNEARTINRRVFGLLDEGQVVILDRMTRTFLAMNEYEQADAQQRAALMLVERKHEPHAEETLDAIYKYAGWLRDRRRYTEERDQYQRAMRIIRNEYGDESLFMVKPLRETANSFRNQGAAVNQGISGLLTALELLDAQESPDALALAEVLVDIGDWEAAFSRVGTDGAAYRRAWQVLDDVDGGNETREQWFGGIEYVFREPLSQRGLSSASDAVPGFVLVRFDLNEFGRTENVTILESEPPNLKDDAVARHVRQSRFRPYLSDGEIVRRRNLALRVTFRYAPTAIDGAASE